MGGIEGQHLAAKVVDDVVGHKVQATRVLLHAGHAALGLVIGEFRDGAILIGGGYAVPARVELVHRDVGNAAAVLRDGDGRQGGGAIAVLETVGEPGAVNEGGCDRVGAGPCAVAIDRPAGWQIDRAERSGPSHVGGGALRHIIPIGALPDGNRNPPSGAVIAVVGDHSLVVTEPDQL